MYQSELLISLIGGAVIGFACGFFTRLQIMLVVLLMSILCLILALGVESWAVSRYLAYDFGDRLFAHLAWSLVAALVTFAVARVLVIFTVARLKNAAANTDLEAIPGSRTQLVATHLLGLFGFYFGFGWALVGAMWLANLRSSATTRAQIREAFQFQVFYLAVSYIGLAIVSFIVFQLGISEDNFMPTVLGLWSLVIAYVVYCSGLGAFIAWRNQCYRYPLNLRFIEMVIRHRQSRAVNTAAPGGAAGA